MTTTATPPLQKNESSSSPSLTTGRLPGWTPWVLLGASIAVMLAVFGVMSVATGEGLNVAAWLITGALLYLVLITVLSAIVEGQRKAVDRLVTGVVTVAFLLAMVPLISVAFTVITLGAPNWSSEFFSSSMRNVVGEGGGALHAIIGTLLITLAATIISVPIGLFTAIYLIEYGKDNKLARGITFLVDVMTGIPSIVAG
ncbi:MAG: phosphate transporter, permease protein PstA, partial [Microbacterium sp.]|nr:phosphate transporter, permease protein PstA [Microbacterium sp.]